MGINPSKAAPCPHVISTHLTHSFFGQTPSTTPTARSIHTCSHHNATNFLLFPIHHPILIHKIAPSCGAISTSTHTAHPWAHLIHYPKRHDLLRHFFHNSPYRHCGQTDRKSESGTLSVPVGHLHSSETM